MCLFRLLIRTAVKVSTLREIVWSVMRQKERLSGEQEQLSKAISTIAPETGQVIELAQRFVKMMQMQESEAVDQWFTDTQLCKLAVFQTFASVLQRDREAVRAAMSSPWSNGPVEGHINRLKLLKRQMYGRAGLDLLKRRVLYSDRCPGLPHPPDPTLKLTVRPGVALTTTEDSSPQPDHTKCGRAQLCRIRSGLAPELLPARVLWCKSRCVL